MACNSLNKPLTKWGDPPSIDIFFAVEKMAEHPMEKRVIFFTPYEDCLRGRIHVSSVHVQVINYPVCPPILKHENGNSTTVELY